MMTKEKIFSWSESHIMEYDDLFESFVLGFDTAKTIFMEKLVGSWKELMEVDFDKVQAANVLRSLMKTMWDFYQMITFFTTHTMENRNRHLAMKAIASTSSQLMGGAIL